MDVTSLHSLSSSDHYSLILADDPVYLNLIEDARNKLLDDDVPTHKRDVNSKVFHASVAFNLCPCPQRLMFSCESAR